MVPKNMLGMHEGKKASSVKNNSICDFSRSYHTVCPRSSDPFYVETYYIKWVTTSRAYNKQNDQTAEITPFKAN